MKPISSARFSALAGYSRQPSIVPIAELEWYEEQDERLLGVIIIEAIDGEYGGVILGRDANRRFRWVDGTRFFSDIDSARAALELTLAKQAKEPNEAFCQGDETRHTTNLLKPVVPAGRMHPIFRDLSTGLRLSAARSIIDAMSPYFRDLDGNFVEQFQTVAFDARLFELYLFAALHEIGYAFDEAYNAPDFHCIAAGTEFFVEAVTANPTDGATPLAPMGITFENEAAAQRYFEGEVAIKIAGPLNSKLQKRYWERPHVAGKPLMLAIQNFSAPMAMMQTSTALSTYLYGWRHVTSRDRDGHLVITPERLTEHRHGEKTIPSNFFSLPGAEHISAVMFNPHATISKFNRIGVVAGFGSPKVKMFRSGTQKDHDPDASLPIRFLANVQDPKYTETWIEGMSVYHNPNATVSLDRELIPGAAHLFGQPDGMLISYTPDFFPMTSVTETIELTDDTAAG